MSDFLHIYILFFSHLHRPPLSTFFFFNDTATTEIYTLSLHDALPIWRLCGDLPHSFVCVLCLLFIAPFHASSTSKEEERSEEHTSELQSRLHLVCRLLLEKKKKNNQYSRYCPTTNI